jgi:UDP-galactopyranose mutase
MEHTYGPHIFNTSNLEVWAYIQKYGKFESFINRVKAKTNNGIFSLPINLHTINQFFGKSLNPSEAKSFLSAKSDITIGVPRNFEEQALKFIGKELYQEFFYGYTRKQWGCEPKELPANILKRLPVRFDYNDNYYNSKYQGIPRDGYTKIIENILDHPHIHILLNTGWSSEMKNDYDHIFYTGPIDEFYQYRFGKLGYRTVYWDKAIYSGDYQGNAVINYTKTDVEYTRVHEHKHFAPWENHDKTIVLTEYSKETGDNDIPYYPKRLAQDIEGFNHYKEHAYSDTKISFLGRLATYRYMDMHHVIGEAIEFSRAFHSAVFTNAKAPIFPD